MKITHRPSRKNHVQKTFEQLHTQEWFTSSKSSNVAYIRCKLDNNECLCIDVDNGNISTQNMKNFCNENFYQIQITWVAGGIEWDYVYE